MKKVLALVLVLGMASLAQASLFTGDLQISVNGAYPDEVTLMPSDTAVLDIAVGGGIPAGGYVDWVMVAIDGPGSLDASKFTSPFPNDEVNYGVSAYNDAAGNGMPIPADDLTRLSSSIFGGLYAYTTAIPQGATLFDNILFHCDDMGDVIVKIYSLDDSFEVLTLQDSILIHQIPEPMTMSLLALGGLGLLRRRR